MTCSDIASGVNVSLGIIPEVQCGVTPSGVSNTLSGTLAVDDPETGLSRITLGAGSLTDEGYKAGQMIEITASGDSANVGFWRVYSVDSATELVIVDGPDGTHVASTVDMNIAYEGLRATERNVNLERDTIESSEVRKDRQFASVRHGFNQVVGNIGYELSLASYDVMIELAMSRPWEEITIGTTGALTLTPATPAAGSAEIVRASGDWLDEGIRPGDVLRTSGSSDPLNNRNWVVTEVVNATTIYVGDPAETTVGSADPTAIVFPGKRIDIGQTLETVTMQRAFNDMPKYQVFRGVTVNSMSWTMATGEPVGGTFDVLGMEAVALADTPLANSSQQPTTDFMSAFDGQLYEGAIFNEVITSMEFTLENNRQLVPVVGSTRSPGVFDGRAGVSGTIAAYFRGGPMFDKFINEEDSAIYMIMNNAGDDEFIALSLPRVKYTGASMDPPQEGPVDMEMPFRALAIAMNIGGGQTRTTSMTIQVSNRFADERTLP